MEGSGCEIEQNGKQCDKPNGVIKSSDFSIDHILNKAGSVLAKPRVTNEVFNIASTERIDRFLIDNQNSFTPILNWLQYSRYRPPRLPRPAKIGPIKRTPGRLPRIPFTPFQLNELENAYKKANYLSAEDANKLAIRLELTCTRVKIWFQNRRARERRENRGKPTDNSLDSSNSSELIVKQRKL